MSRFLNHLGALAACLTSLSAGAFEAGQRVWIDLPAVNINDDSYGEGQVLRDPGQGLVEVHVSKLTTSKAFSSGVFCAAPAQQSEGWDSPAVYNITTDEVRQLPRQQLLPWRDGYNRFYERQNWLHTFLKWVDRHPVLERSQLEEHGKRMASRGDTDLATVSRFMLAEYDAYQTPQFRFYPENERLRRLLPVIESILQELKNNPALEKAWRPKTRQLDDLNHSSYTLFMTQALDKIIEDTRKSRRFLASRQPDAPELKQMDALLQQLERR